MQFTDTAGERSFAEIYSSDLPSLQEEVPGKPLADRTPTFCRQVLTLGQEGIVTVAVCIAELTVPTLDGQFRSSTLSEYSVPGLTG
ncbi:MAG: hypothetical protein WC076_09785 [Terrimicrobiaceae bacterium]|jgi:hypothetical protein|nr:hypothetical protein [Terrimicrobiaceae bacterium]